MKNWGMLVVSQLGPNQECSIELPELFVCESTPPPPPPPSLGSLSFEHHTKFLKQTMRVLSFLSFIYFVFYARHKAFVSPVESVYKLLIARLLFSYLTQVLKDFTLNYLFSLRVFHGRKTSLILNQRII